MTNLVAIGDPISRVDGKAKVTGTAKYSAEFQISRMAHASLVMSTIPSGRITRINISEAERAPGVIAVITPQNAFRLPGNERRLALLQNDEVFYQNQPVAMVVA